METSCFLVLFDKTLFLRLKKRRQKVEVVVMMRRKRGTLLVISFRCYTASFWIESKNQQWITHTIAKCSTLNSFILALIYMFLKLKEFYRPYFNLSSKKYVFCFLPSIGELLCLMVRSLKYHQINNEFLNSNWDWKCCTEFLFHCPQFVIVFSLHLCIK